MKSIADKCKECRESLGLTQEEMAKKLGLKTAGAVNKFESGQRRITKPSVAHGYVRLGKGLIKYEDFFEKTPIKKPLTRPVSKRNRKITPVNDEAHHAAP